MTNVTQPTVDLLAVCDGCGKPVDDGTGYQGTIGLYDVARVVGTGHRTLPELAAFAQFASLPGMNAKRNGFPLRVGPL